MNLISGVHHLCERREHVFMVLREYTIISRIEISIVFSFGYSSERIRGVFVLLFASKSF